MSDKPIQAGTVLEAEQVNAVSGGSCSPGDVLPIIQSLTQAYESLIDFTSHVIERVVQ